MKLSLRSLALAVASAALILTGCSNPAEPKDKDTDSNASTALLNLTFTSDADAFESGDSWAADSMDKTTGQQTINVYGGSHTYTPAATLDLSKAVKLTVDVKGDVKVNTSATGNSAWWFSGFRIVLVDEAGKKFDLVDFKDTTDFNNTDFTTVTRTLADGVWESKDGVVDTGDLSKIASIVIYTNYNQGSLVLKNLKIE